MDSLQVRVVHNGCCLWYLEPCECLGSVLGPSDCVYQSHPAWSRSTSDFLPISARFIPKNLEVASVSVRYDWIGVLESSDAPKFPCLTGVARADPLSKASSPLSLWACWCVLNSAKPWKIWVSHRSQVTLQSSPICWGFKRVTRQVWSIGHCRVFLCSASGRPAAPSAKLVYSSGS